MCCSASPDQQRQSLRVCCPSARTREALRDLRHKGLSGVEIPTVPLRPSRVRAQGQSESPKGSSDVPVRDSLEVVPPGLSLLDGPSGRGYALAQAPEQCPKVSGNLIRTRQASTHFAINPIRTPRGPPNEPSLDTSTEQIAATVKGPKPWAKLDPTKRSSQPGRRSLIAPLISRRL